MRRAASVLRACSLPAFVAGLGVYPLRGYSYSHVCTRAPCSCGKHPAYDVYAAEDGYLAVKT